MAKQTFTTGQVLTAAQMTSLQQTAMGGGAATAKTASYTLVAADAGTVVQMNSASATTITVNTGLFAAGDTVQIQNVGAGVCTVTAGTATVSTSAVLALKQYDAGSLYFNSTGAALFFAADAADASTGKVVQIVYGSTATVANNSTATLADSGLTATITPTSASNKVLVMVSQNGVLKSTNDTSVVLVLLRGATQIMGLADRGALTQNTNTNTISISGDYLDSPATTSATTYKTQFSSQAGNSVVYCQQVTGSTSSIVLMEVTP